MVVVDRRDRDGRVVVHVAGEIDLATCDELQAALLAAVGDSATVVVDLRDVAFFDASGLGALVAGHAAASRRGGSLLLVHVPPLLRRILAVTALDSVLSVRTCPGDRPAP